MACCNQIRPQALGLIHSNFFLCFFNLFLLKFSHLFLYQQIYQLIDLIWFKISAPKRFLLWFLTLLMDLIVIDMVWPLSSMVQFWLSEGLFTLRFTIEWIPNRIEVLSGRMNDLMAPISGHNQLAKSRDRWERERGGKARVCSVCC